MVFDAADRFLGLMTVLCLLMATGIAAMEYRQEIGVYALDLAVPVVLYHSAEPLR